MREHTPQDRHGGASDHGGPAMLPRPGAAVTWHELECGHYEADMSLWHELADAARGPVLEIGAGTGRVALALAGRGHAVSALDRDRELLGELAARARQMRLERLETVLADARSFDAPRGAFALCIVPMQTLQLLGGVQGRRLFFERARACLRPGGVLACAIVTDVELFDASAGGSGAEPEMARVDELLYVSRAVRVRADERTLWIERERSVLAGEAAAALVRDPSIVGVAPRGPGERDVVGLARVQVEQLQREGAECGLRPRGTRTIPGSEEYTASVAVIFDG